MVTPANLAVEPASYSAGPGVNSCTGKSFTFVVFGGTPPYNVRPTQGTANPQIVNAAGGTTTISLLLDGSGLTSIVFLDSSLPQKSFTATITCN